MKFPESWNLIGWLVVVVIVAAVYVYRLAIAKWLGLESAEKTPVYMK